MESKINPAIVDELNSKQTADIIKALRKLRKSGKVSYLPFIFAVFESNSDELLFSELEMFLCDIKDSKAIPYFLERIKAEKAGLKQIVTACWSSGIDYSAHLEDFIELFLNSDLEVALEAYSVIEEWGVLSREEDQQKAVLKLKASSQDLERTKRAMAETLIVMLTQ
jgi:hypothetical protein